MDAEQTLSNYDDVVLDQQDYLDMMLNNIDRYIVIVATMWTGLSSSMQGNVVIRDIDEMSNVIIIDEVPSINMGLLFHQFTTIPHQFPTNSPPIHQPNRQQ